MKVYLSADIEGITGSTHWDETDKKHSDFSEFREQMTAEVVAACEGALQAGATEIWVKDAHDSARNLIAARLPTQARLLRGWSGHPYQMVEGLDASFKALLMIGYHSRAGSDTNPLAHTMSGSAAYVKINGLYASEFMINTYTASLENVPAVFVSGDAGLCVDAARLVPALTCVAVKEGVGNGSINLHPHLAVEKIKAGVRDALEKNTALCHVPLPDHFNVEVRYKEHAPAYQHSFYPGASLKEPHTIVFETDRYFDVLRFFAYVF